MKGRMKMNNNEIMKLAIAIFGAKQQQMKAIEELSELVVELAKDLNGLPSNITEELADAEIMIEQMKVTLNISPEQIEEVKHKKLSRLAERLKKIEMEKAESIMKSIPKVKGTMRAVRRCLECGIPFGIQFIPFSSEITYFDACKCQTSSNASSVTIIESDDIHESEAGA